MESNELRTITLTPKSSIKEARDFLDGIGVSYCHYDEDNVIFANLFHTPPPGLSEICGIEDPVVKATEAWNVRYKGEHIGSFKSEQEARSFFVVYTSWVGEFVNNGPYKRDDA
jgi:hypothetical protein